MVSALQAMLWKSFIQYYVNIQVYISMLSEFDLKFLHFNSIRNFFHYHGETKPGMMFKIFNNQYALSADQSEWMSVMETGQTGSFFFVEYQPWMKLILFPKWSAVSPTHITSFPHWFKMPHLSYVKYFKN